MALWLRVYAPREEGAVGWKTGNGSRRRIRLRRMADPEDVAKAILFLSSELASYVTGNILVLDGAGRKHRRKPWIEIGVAGSCTEILDQTFERSDG